MLLAASCYFYMAFIPVYILILFVTITIDYFAGIQIEKAAEQDKKKWLSISVISTCLVLMVFKYANFTIGNVNHLFSFFGTSKQLPYWNIILPIGLSFHTFQSLSYIIEVYRGSQKAEHNYGIFSLYVMFYPQLLAGPIERPQNLLHQFYEKHSFNPKLATSGLRLLVWGMFKKVVIADRIAHYVTVIYAHPDHFYGFNVILALLLFTFQVYYDFSAYTDIARGAARVMGFRLIRNFNLPFAAQSLTDFWRRWHISLISWFNDYLYTPVVMLKRQWGKWAAVYGIIITFLLSGLWHGAAWKFVIWGGLNAIGLTYEMLTRKSRQRIGKSLPGWLNKCASMIIVFCYLSFIGIFFRADNLHDAWTIIRNMPVLNHSDFHFRFLNNKEVHDIMLSIALIIFVQCVESLAYHKKLGKWFLYQPAYLRFAAYYLTIMSIIWLGVFEQIQFVYFQF